MAPYDLIFIHPPAIYDFRKKPLFPGPLGRTVESVQFTKAPIGMLSLAEYLDRHGYKVYIDNIGDRMATLPGFDVEQHLESCSASIFGIGMHFQQHAQGALELARRIKLLHPGSLVILGGLTATRFHEEIVSKYNFVDAVVRAEAEKPLLALVRAFEKHGVLTPTPNLTYRNPDGVVCSTPLMPASEHLDDYNFTRFDLIEPKTCIYSDNSCHRWSLALCRGCAYNCAICGGSAYTYKKYLGMRKPAFRSPANIVADMKRLNDQNVTFIGLYQDPRMAGDSYWRELLGALAREKPRIERLSLDLLAPADEPFIRDIAGIGRNVILHLCPDVGSDSVRRLLGRPYTNQALLATMKLCLKYRIPVTNFFSVGLAGETEAEIKETWKLWERLDAMNHEAQVNGYFGDINDAVPIGGQVLGPIVLDPGSQAYDAPQAFGYTLLYDNLEEYIHGMSQPSWHQWLNYETRHLSKKAIIELILQSIEFTIDQREKHGFYAPAEARYERCRVEADRAVVAGVDSLMALKTEKERQSRAIAMRKNLDTLETRRMTFFSE